MSESRRILPFANLNEGNTRNIRSLSSGNMSSTRSVVPTISSITNKVSGAINRLFSFNVRKIESRKQELMDSATLGLNSINELVTDQHDTLREIIEIIKRIKLEPYDDGSIRGRRPRGRGRARARARTRARSRARVRAQTKKRARARARNRIRPPLGDSSRDRISNDERARQQRIAQEDEARRQRIAQEDEIRQQRIAQEDEARRQRIAQEDEIRQQNQRSQQQQFEERQRYIREQEELNQRIFREQVERFVREEENRARTEDLPRPPAFVPPEEAARLQSPDEVQRVQPEPERTTTPEQVTRQTPGADIARGAGSAGRTGSIYGAAAAAAVGGDSQEIARAAGQAAATSAGIAVLAQGSEIVIREAAARSLARQISTKIPIAGLLAGLWFSGERALASDWVGAGLEITAAGAGTLGGVTFGLGTAASVSLDIISLTRDVYKALFGIFPEQEENTELRNQRLQAIGTNLTTALQELIANTPQPTRPPINNETRTKILEILALIREDENLYNAIGPDVVAGVSRLLAQTTNLNGNSPMQRRTREGLENILNRFESIITSRRSASEQRLEEPENQNIITPQNSSNETPSASEVFDNQDLSQYLTPTNNTSQENILQISDGSLENIENILRSIGNIQFNEIRFEATDIEFDGEIESDQEENITRVSSPVSANITENANPSNVSSLIGMLGSAVGVTPENIASSTTGGEQQTQIPTDVSSLIGMLGSAVGVTVPENIASGGTGAPTPQSSAGGGVTTTTPAVTIPTVRTPTDQTTPASADFMSEVNRVSARFGINPNDLLAVMRSESSLNPRAVNSETGASGLIQFMPRTARSLGTTVEAIRQMSAVEQMRYVERYFQSVGVRPGSSAGRLYAYVFLPGRAGRDVLTQAGERYYEANRGLDVNRDGRITIEDLDARLARHGASNTPATAQMQQTTRTEGARVAEQSAQQTILDRDRARLTLMEEARARSQRGRLGQKENSGSITPGRPGTTVSREVPLVNRLQRAAG